MSPRVVESEPASLGGWKVLFDAADETFVAAMSEIFRIDLHGAKLLITRTLTPEVTAHVTVASQRTRQMLMLTLTPVDNEGNVNIVPTRTRERRATRSTSSCPMRPPSCR